MRAETDKAQSEFNMAISYLGRLNFLFSQADEASIMLNSHTWFHVLQAIYRELSPEINKDEQIDWEKKTDNINYMVAKQIKLSGKTGETGIRPDLYKALHEYELFLRGILDRAGLQTKRADDASSALR